MVKDPKLERATQSSKSKFKLEVRGKSNTDDKLYCLLNEYSHIPSKVIIPNPIIQHTQSLMTMTKTPSGNFKYRPLSSNIKKYDITTNSKCINIIHEKYINKLFK